ncbi:MAG: A/G-specific adenine glycosylase [Paracoccaceae bacterium]
MDTINRAGAARAAAIGVALADWYGAHARAMPWRVGPADRARGILPNPYHVWLSEVMLQQTTVAAVTGYFDRFIRRWPRLEDLAAAADGDVMAEWAGLGYYARARNLLKCARAVVADHQGQFPSSHAALRALPGIGPYTAAALSSIAFDQRAVVVDGNVERLVSRLFAVTEPLPRSKLLLTDLAGALTPVAAPGDHAQAMMDLGATICTPRNPGCGVCPLTTLCQARAEGMASALPRRLPKPVKPIRQGIAYVGLRADGALLLERRPDRGLLGGTLGWPGSDWTEAAPDPAPPCAGDWQATGAEVRHTFTHFHLVLTVLRAELPQGANPSRGTFLPAADFRATDLPSVMRKVFNAATSQLEPGKTRP